MNIISENIHLEALELKHAEAIFKTIDSERTYLQRWLPFVENTQKEDDSLAFIHSVLDAPQKEWVFAVFYKKQFAGLIGFKGTDTANRKTEIGYWLSEKQQGKGIITTSCKHLINNTFNNTDMNRIQICVAEGNMKSRAIPERLGFTYEGNMRDGELLSSGFTDIRVYSMLKHEWVY